MAERSLFATDLYLVEECPRCAWLFLNHNLRRPRSPFPTVLEAIDKIAKAYFDRFRDAGTLPPCLADVAGKLAPRGKLRALHKPSGIGLAGEPDEVLALRDGSYAALDHKSRGREVPQEPHAAYRTQLDAYAFLLRESMTRAAGVAYLAYWIPQPSQDPTQGAPFAVDVREVAVDPARAQDLLARAAALVGAPRPAPAEACEHCRWAAEQAKFAAAAPRGGLSEKQVRLVYALARKAKETGAGGRLSRDELEAAVADDVREAFGKPRVEDLARDEFEKLLDRYRSDA